jgi:sugar phosphate isomerase/epimerase
MVAGQTGFRGVELRLAAAAELAERQGMAGLRQRLSDAGLAVAGFGYPIPLRSTAEEFGQALAGLPALLELARSIGAAGGTVVLPFRQLEGYTLTRAETIERIGRLAELAERQELALYLEFIGLHFNDGLSWGKTLAHALDIALATGQDNVGLLIDSYHWHLGGSQTSDLDRIPVGMPILLHINDAPPGAPVTLNDSMRVLPGEGVIDLPAWLKAIRAATGYDGFVSLELFSEELRTEEPAMAAQRAWQALDGILAQLQ